MKYLYTKTEHYKLFVKENKNNRLSKDIKILPESDKMSLFKISLNSNLNEEIYDKPLETDYKLLKIKDNFIKVLFQSKSNINYRLDIHTIVEKNGIVNHISFTEDDIKYDIIPDKQSDFEQYEIDYNRLTGKNEMIELMNRIHYILSNLLSNDDLSNNSFCIGGTELIEKNNIYEYLLKVIVGDGGFEKINTDIYSKVGWGLYFSINK
jgi:hypothetical protein